MKTLEQLKERLCDIEVKVLRWQERFAQYGNIEGCINDWEGRTKEFSKLEELTTEQLFLERAIKYLY